jgi:hypothetical protein
MKNYSQEVISNIQKAIDEKQYTLKDIVSFDEMPQVIKLNGVTINLITTDSGFHDAILTLADTFDNKDSGIYKHESFGKFYSKDWKRGNKGEETYKRYKLFSATIKGVEIVVLIRNTADYEYQENDEPNYYADLIIDDIPFTIIKAYCPSINETFADKSLFDEQIFKEKLIDAYGFIVKKKDKDDNSDEDEEDDDTEYIQEDSIESEELF